MDWERRTLYRAGLSHVVLVEMGVTDLVPGRLENLTAAGARVAFDVLPEGFAVDAEVRIMFASDQLLARIELSGIVKYVSASAVGVAFHLPESAPSEIFSRRSAFRAKPRARDGEAMVSLRNNRREVGRGKLLDISTTGLAVLVDPDVAERVGDEVDLQIFLPETTLAVAMHGTVRERRLTGSSFRLGIHLVPEGPDGLSNQRLIYDFVVRRQRDLIRQLMNVMSAQPERIAGG